MRATHFTHREALMMFVVLIGLAMALEGLCAVHLLKHQNAIEAWLIAIGWFKEGARTLWERILAAI